jgi:hypothetical protein
LEYRLEISWRGGRGRRLGERRRLAREKIGSEPKTALDVNPGPAGSAEPENPALLRPGERQAGMGEQLLRGEVSRMAAFENCPRDIGSEIGEAQHPGEIRAGQPLALRDIGEIFAAALSQLVAEAVRADDQLDQLRVGFGSLPPVKPVPRPAS